MAYCETSSAFRDLVDPVPSWTLASGDRAPADARADVVGQLEAWHLSRLVDDAVLIVSELVTNAVRFGRSVRLVLHAIQQGARRALRIEVSDQGPGLPAAVTGGVLPDEECCHGRGLPLIDLLADRWGAERGDGDNVVWAELEIYDGSQLTGAP